MLADLCASHDLMETLAPFLVATELPLCPLLGVSKAVRRAYLAAARGTGLLRKVARMLPASQIEYTLHWHRFEPIELYLDDEGAVQTRTIAPRLPLAWTVRVRTPEVDAIASHGVPCCDLWKTVSRVRKLDRFYASWRRVLPYAVLTDWPTAMYLLHDGSTTPHDLADLITHLGLGSSCTDFFDRFVAPLVRVQATLNDAAARLRAHTEVRGLARLGASVVDRA